MRDAATSLLVSLLAIPPLIAHLTGNWYVQIYDKHRDQDQYKKEQVLQYDFHPVITHLVTGLGSIEMCLKIQSVKYFKGKLALAKLAWETRQVCVFMLSQWYILVLAVSRNNALAVVGVGPVCLCWPCSLWRRLPWCFVEVQPVYSQVSWIWKEVECPTQLICIWIFFCVPWQS